MNKVKIVMILSEVPGYSETFFRSKIRGLLTLPNVEVFLAVDGSGSMDFGLCPLIRLNNTTVKSIPTALRFIWDLILTIFRFPLISYSVLRHSESTLANKFVNLVKMSRIFPLKPSWIYYGFGTLAIGREHMAKILNARMGVSFRGFDYYLYPLNHPGCYNRVLNYTDKIHVLSNGMRKGLIRQGYPEGRIHVITPAIDLELFHSTNRSESEKLRFITVGRLHWVKGVEFILTAFGICHSRGLDFEYNIVGEGPEYERLKFIALQADLESKVHFKGKYAPEQIRNLMEESDVYIQYSIEEGFCNAVIEAQAMGLPCICSDCEGLRENIAHEVTGWLVAGADSEALAEQIYRVAAMEKSELNKMRAQAKLRVQEHFDLNSQVLKFTNFYLEA